MKKIFIALIMLIAVNIAISQPRKPGTGVGTVTEVTSANSDISVANGTTTPALTVNSGSTANKLPKYDANGRLGIAGTPADARGATVEVFGKLRSAVSAHTWPTTSNGGANWGPRDSWLYGISDSGLIGIAGYSRASDLAWDATETIGAAGFVIGDSSGRSVWALYGDVQQDTGNYAFGLELAVKNNTTDRTSTPYSGGLGTYGIWLAAGGDSTYGGYPSNPSNTAVMIGKNSSTWNKGILFRSDGLTGSDGTTGTAVAIEMAKGHKINWLGPSNIQGASIRSDVATTAKDVGIVFGDDSISIQGASGVPLAKFIKQAGGTVGFGLGTGSPLSTFHLVTPDNEVTRVADNMTDATQKDFRLGVVHYTNATVPFGLLMGQSGSTTNVISYGGGTGLMTSATSHLFFTAANNTTTSGTQRLAINSDGSFTFNSVVRGSDAFTTTATSDDVAISGATVNDYYLIQPTGTAAPAATDAMTVEATSTGFTVRRGAAGTSGLTYNWWRIK